MSDNTKTRLCQYHFAMRDVVCSKGCGEICIVAEPEKVNAALSAQLRDRQELQARINDRDTIISDLKDELAALREAGHD